MPQEFHVSSALAGSAGSAGSIIVRTRPRRTNQDGKIASVLREDTT